LTGTEHPMDLQRTVIRYRRSHSRHARSPLVLKGRVSNSSDNLLQRTITNNKCQYNKKTAQQQENVVERQ
jgi:hypothetical protein